jgi:hypothetical protein
MLQREWDVEYTTAFFEWWDGLSAEEQVSVGAVVDRLQERGVRLGYPLSSRVSTSRHPHLRELRVQHAGRPLRVLYAFDPRRTAILLLGGEKTSDDRWYERSVPRADRLYDEHLMALRQEGRI